jgi:hypothetical protein
MLRKLLEMFLGALPFFFGLAFLAPLSVQVMAEFGVNAIGGVDMWTVALIIFGAWGGVASWTGRWI